MTIPPHIRSRRAQNLIITCMKNEGPFILEWVAHHLSIGFDHMLVFTNDCDDGTTEILDALDRAGYVTRLNNPYLKMDCGGKPQKGALKYAESLELVQTADWVLVSDVDEFVNIHVGDGDLESLFAAIGDADLISMQWRLFGNSFINSYEDVLITERHTYCAPEFCPAPIQAWAFKTMYRPRGQHVAGVYGEIGVHRPLKRQGQARPNWITGAGRQIREDFLDQGWRLGIRDHGYDLVTLNHYGVRNAESFLVKRDRGRVNHVNRDQGLSYWMRMNFNMERDFTILRRLEATKAKLDQLMELEGVHELQMQAVSRHKAKIACLMATDNMRDFYEEITSEKMVLLSRHLNFLTRSQFNDGPAVVSSQLIERLKKVPIL